MPREMAVVEPNAVSFEALYRAHREQVFHLGLRYGGGRIAWAEDLVQDVFCKLFEQLSSLDRPDDVGGWLYRVAANLAVSRLRRERLLSRILGGWRAEQQEAEWPDDAELAPGKLATEALAMLRRLPSRERVVVCMKLLDDKPQKEIASILSLSEGYVSKLYRRACGRLAAAGWEVPHAAA